MTLAQLIEGGPHTQADLGRLLGVSRATVHSWLTRERIPAEHLHAIATIYELDAERARALYTGNGVLLPPVLGGEGVSRPKPWEVCDMPDPYRAPDSRDPIDAKDGSFNLKGCTLLGPPSPTLDLGDADLVVPDGLVVEICPPGVALGARDWSGLGGAHVHGNGRRVGGARADY